VLVSVLAVVGSLRPATRRRGWYRLSSIVFTLAAIAAEVGLFLVSHARIRDRWVPDGGPPREWTRVGPFDATDYVGFAVLMLIVNPVIILLSYRALRRPFAARANLPRRDQRRRSV
jgi:hypothetical protein